MIRDGRTGLDDCATRDMRRPASLDDMLACARTLWSEARDEPEIGLVHLAWVIRNRAWLGGEYRRAVGVPHPVYGDGTLGAACRDAGAFPVWSGAPEARSAMMRAGFDDPRFCRAFATACLVWSGDYGEPLAGAVDFHRHDEAPRWAATRDPAALIGAHFYYPPERGAA